MSLEGKVIVFTGKLPTMTRAEATQKAKDAGARVVTAMSGNVNLVITETDSSSSTTGILAEAGGVERWSEAEFLKNLEGKKTKAAKKPAAKKTAAKAKAEEEAKDETAPPTKKGAKVEKAPSVAIDIAPTPVPAATAAATPAPAAAAPSGGVSRVVDRLVPNREQYKIHENYVILLNQTNIGQNNNKYYIIQLLKKDGDSKFYCWTRWGRVGEPGQNAMIPAADEKGGIKAFEGKFKDKTMNEWSKRDSFVPKSGKYTIVEVDEKDGDSGGDNKAPMGKLSRSQIEKGQLVLAEITAAINGGQSKTALVELSSRFFTLIPTNFGRQVPQPLLTVDKVTEKEELLKFYLRMGFEEVDKDEKKLPPLSGVMDLPIPKTLAEAIGSAADKASITSSVSKGDVLAKKQAGGPVRVMNKEEYGSIMLYTSNAIYRDLNKVLRDENRLGVQKYFSYLRLLFAAADALPQKNVQLWRGISVDLSKQYTVGSKIVWWGVSSCTSDQQVARNFMNGCGGDCSFLTIDTKTAVDISQITFYSNEKESLLMPGTELLVKKVEKKGKIAEIHLEEVGRLLN